MLKGISPAISPELLKVLSEMGHGDEIVFADAHFPGHSMNSRVLRADGVGVGGLFLGVGKGLVGGIDHERLCDAGSGGVRRHTRNGDGERGSSWRGGRARFVAGVAWTCPDRSQEARRIRP